MRRLPSTLWVAFALLGTVDAVASVKPVSPPPSEHVGFTLLPAETARLSFTNRLPFERYVTNQIHLNGSGVAAGDIDGDSLCDLFFAGLGGGSRLYRNLGGWRFEDITEQSGLSLGGLDATGAAFADLDGDGDLDLVVNSIRGGSRVFLNGGKGRFTPGATLNASRAGHSLALADLDGDGDLDLYVANYRSSTLRDMPNTKFRVVMRDGRPEIASVNDQPVTDPDLEGRYRVDLQGKVTEQGEPDALFLNDGKANFTPVSFTDGTFLDEDGKPLPRPPYDWSLSVMARDLNQDGSPDLYICSDFSPPDRLWINDGRGHFRAIERLALRNTPMFSMGMDVADIDRDGVDDLFVSDMLSRSHLRRMIQVGDLVPVTLEPGRIDDRPQYLRNTLQHGRGDGTYAEIARFANLAASEWTWCPVFLDVDLDGYEDLLLSTGHERDAMNGDFSDQVQKARRGRQLTRAQVLELNRIYEPLATPNVAFRNLRNGTFEDVGQAWGFVTPGVSQGQAMADLDNDGDIDLAVNQLNRPAALYRNDTAAPRLAVRLHGLPPNTSGIGARIVVEGGPVRQTQEIIAGGYYLSASEAMRVFAAGSATNRLKVEVAWRSGRRTTVADVPANSIVTVEESDSAPVPPPNSIPVALWFDDATARLGHAHVDGAFDDFARQPLLPRKLSQLGPGVTWADVNNDGFDDLVVGSGNGGVLGMFLGDGRGGFTGSKAPPMNYAVTRDQTSVLAWPRGPGDWVIIAGSANYEDGLDIGPLARQYDLAHKTMDDSLPAAAWSAGALALADYDGDGDLDLLIAGRCRAGRFPEPVPARLFRRGKEAWEADEANSRVLDAVGPVCGATFSDLTGDGWPELVLACEWGPVRIFRNDRGQLVPWNPMVRGSLPDSGPAGPLGSLTGWWQGVAAGDIDGDGRLDLVVGNWGWNTFQRPSPDHPLRLYSGDLDESGNLGLVEAAYDPESRLEVPLRGLKAMRAAFPFVEAAGFTYRKYGNSSVADLLGARFPTMRVSSARTLCSVALLNRGEEFEVRALPAEAQWAPALGVCIADFDGDGSEDVFLSQNFFAVNPDHWRYDAGRGLLLRGEGRGELTPLPGQESGIKVYGEQRGAAVSDYDGDGRLDLAVAQNANSTRLFRNVRARPGVRVRLNGPPGNHCGFGAVIRLESGGRAGSARETHAGSGYWSQDSAVTVLAMPEGAATIRVRWPGGKELAYDVPAGAREVLLGVDGAAKLVR